jgi:hypothetical protein
MSCNTDGYSNDVETESYHKARKEHVCCACGETIRKGDRYRKTFVVFEGDVDTYKHCLRCATLMDAISKRIRDGERNYEEAVAWELDCGHTWQENFDEEPPEEIARLAFLTPDEMQRELAPK